jgi:hypothetical protein
MSSRPNNLGELRRSAWSEEKIGRRSVKQELRNNLLARLESGEPLFPEFTATKTPLFRKS